MMMPSSHESTPSSRLAQPFPYATLPPHAPAIIVENTINLKNVDGIYTLVESARRREFSNLIRKYIQQIVHGCDRQICDVPSCFTARKRVKANARTFTAVSARILACQLATADEPYKALCPGVMMSGPLSTEKPDSGARDTKSFTQQLFNTIPLKKLELLNLPPSSELIQFGSDVTDNQQSGADDTTKTLTTPSLSRDVSSVENYSDASDTTENKSTAYGKKDMKPDALSTPQHSHHVNYTTPHQIQSPWSPPPRSRRYSRQKSVPEDKIIQDINNILSPNLSKVSKTSSNVQSHPPTTASPIAKPTAPPLPTARQTQMTPSRTGRTKDDQRAEHSPTSTIDDYPKLPQVLTSLTIDTADTLMNMCSDPDLSPMANHLGDLFARQSLWHMLSTPASLCHALSFEDSLEKRPTILEGIFRALMVKDYSNDIFKALWKCVESLFPVVKSHSKSDKSRKTVTPSSVSEYDAATIVIVCFHALAASLPEASPEVWEQTRRSRGMGEISHAISLEDELAIRLTSRLVRALSSYKLFAPGVMAHIERHFNTCGSLARANRLTWLGLEFGRDLAAEFVSTNIGKGGWSLAVCSLEWVRRVVLAEWDGENQLVKHGVVESGVAFLKFLYKHCEAFGLEQVYFQNQIMADRFDLKETAVEWYQAKNDKMRPYSRTYLLSHPFLFPPASLVTFFRSINYHLMSKAYDTAISNLRFIHQMANTVDLQNYLERDLYKRLKVSMTMYFLIEVHRPTILQDALNQIFGREPRECTRPLKVRFLDVGEEGVDHGGVQQEFFAVLWSEALRPEYGMFVTDPITHMSWFSITPLEPVHKYELLGILVSLAVYNGVTLPVTFPKALYQKLLGLPVTEIEHIEDGWPDLAKGLRGLLDWPEEQGDVSDGYVLGYEFNYEAWGKVSGVDMQKIARNHPWQPKSLKKQRIKRMLRRGLKGKQKAQNAIPTFEQELDGVVSKADELEIAFNERVVQHINEAIHNLEGSRVVVQRNHDQLFSSVDEAAVAAVVSASTSKIPDVVDLDEKIDGKDSQPVPDVQSEDEEEKDRSLRRAQYTSEKHEWLFRPEAVAGDPYDEIVETDEPEAELVTNATRKQYVEDYIFWLTDKSVRRQFEAFRRGFMVCLDSKALSLFNPTSLRHLVEGIQDIDVVALEKAARYDDGYSPTHRLIKDFWAIVRAFSPERKRQLLEFVTASDRVPVNGVGSLMFVIQRNGPDSDRVPTSLTCFGRLLLPEYSSKKKLSTKLKLALENGKGFGVP